MYLPYISADKQTVLGHYSLGQRSGEIVATPAAGVHLARIRWAPTLSNTFCVLLRLRVGLTVSAAITTAVETAFKAIIARSFTVDFTAAMTAINLATTANTNKMRSAGVNAMGNSQMGASGPGIVTTVAAGMTGQTMTVDAAPFAICSMPNPSSTLGAAAVTNQVGAGVPMTTLYERGADGFHPVILANNEGVIVQNQLAMHATGTVGFYCEWTWAEVAVLP